MPTIEGRLDEAGFPLIDLRVIPSPTPLTVLIDTGFDGELVVYYDDLDRIGIDARVNRVVRARLADGSQSDWPGATLTVDWFGEARAIDASLVPAIRPPRAYPLIGCRLLRESRLDIDFRSGTVLVSRA